MSLSYINLTTRRNSVTVTYSRMTQWVGHIVCIDEMGNPHPNFVGIATVEETSFHTDSWVR